MTMIQILGEWLVRSSILMLAGMLLLRLLRVKNPSLRLMALTAMLAGSLSMPVLTGVLPKVSLALLRPSAGPVATAAPVLTGKQIGRASCRERVYISVV